MHTGYELLHDNAKVIHQSINKIDIIGVEFHCRTWHEWKTLYSDHFYQAPGAFVVMIILHLPFGRWSLEVIFQLNEDFSCGVGPHNFLVIALYTYKWGYEIDN